MTENESNDETLFYQYPKAKMALILDCLKKAENPQVEFTGDFLAMAKEAHQESRRLISKAIEMLTD